MTEQKMSFFVISAIGLLAAFFLKKFVIKTAENAIAEKQLSTGIYRLFPVEGDQAVRLAKGYISGIKILFWFVVLFFPFMYWLFTINDAF